MTPPEGSTVVFGIPDLAPLHAYNGLGHARVNTRVKVCDRIKDDKYYHAILYISNVKVPILLSI